MRRGVAALLACALLAAPAPALAQQIAPLPYDALPPLAPHLLDFDRLPPKAYPGYSFDHGISFPGGRLGERLAGQGLDSVTLDEGGPHDVLTGAPVLPLAIEPGAPGEGVSLSLHQAFGTMALYPLGPLGQPHPQARGEGAVALLFDEDACGFGFRVHTEYTNALGLNAGHSGRVDVTFHARDGARLARMRLTPPEGISDHGFADPAARIAAVTIENRDPGGISLDDIRFGCPRPMG
ncbi:MAG: hypothetical protein ACLFRU_03580 [Paracoccaceae bacterium]